ncbi:MAG TPA: BON domain-containing protein [Desulfuromonadales bacterium]|nr:BON domain-containing protein [Desulfuromonadales bacterium]
MADAQDLQKNLEAALTQHGRINAAKCELQLSIDGNRVLLQGKLDSVAAKRLIRSVAAQTAGIEQVKDQTLVARPEKMGDQEMTRHIHRAFIQDGNIELEQVQIESDQLGRVTLRGKVHSLMQLRLCEVICWWVPGVADVDNQLTVDPPEPGNDDELRDNLLVILSKDRLVQPENFQVLVRDGIVFLQGQARSEAEKSAAENNCWYCPGVVDVDNRLSLG